MSINFTPMYTFKDVILITIDSFDDNRGAFAETFREDLFKSAGLPKFVQENHSISVPNCIRGLHYQLNPNAQGKLVSCVGGSIVDVFVDIRKGSPTYGKWATYYLNDLNHDMIYVPPGFAHGFITHGVGCVRVMYKVTNYYSPENDRCIRWDDPDIGIVLPEFIPKSGHIISDKDKNGSLLKDADNNFVYTG